LYGCEPGMSTIIKKEQINLRICFLNLLSRRISRRRSMTYSEVISSPDGPL